MGGGQDLAAVARRADSTRASSAANRAVVFALPACDNRLSPAANTEPDIRIRFFGSAFARECRNTCFLEIGGISGRVSRRQRSTSGSALLARARHDAGRRNGMALPGHTARDVASIARTSR